MDHSCKRKPCYFVYTTVALDSVFILTPPNISIYLYSWTYRKYKYIENKTENQCGEHPITRSRFC